MKLNKIIRKVLLESIQDDIIAYAEKYIDDNTCKQILADMKLFRNAVNRGEVSISEDDKKELDRNISNLSLAMNFGCDGVKKMMKEKLREEVYKNMEKVKTSLCWSANNIKKENPSFCQPRVEPPKPTPSATTTQVKTPTATPSQPIGGQPTGGTPTQPKKPFNAETWEF